MSLLYPLYALAALGVAAPILFHLFQRKPQGKREFSSLLFLSPTPPKVTSRSRLSDLLLLLCRALMLLLLAIAFARPFMRSVTLLDVAAPARSVVLLVDTSASMRRDNVWQQTQSAIKNAIGELHAEDEVALVSFDRTPTVEVGFEAWRDFATSGRMGWLQQQAAELEPSWHKTDLATALTYASDLLLQQSDDADTQSEKSLQIVLISDIQEGADLSSLQAYRWPSEVDVKLQTIEPANRSNASLQWLPAGDEAVDSEHIRVLVRNESNSQAAQLELDWQDQVTPKYTTHVPPGQTRVVKIKQPAGIYQLTLQGDDQTFDNRAFFPIVKPVEQELWFAGSNANATDRDGLFYYLQRSPLDTRSRKVQVRRVDQAAAIATATVDKVPLMIVEKPWDQSTEDLRRYVMAGGRLLVVLTGDQSQYGLMQVLISSLLGVENVSIQDVGQGDERSYAMLSNVDFQNALLQPFADPRYSDFTKIRFWSHRRLTSDSTDAWNVVAAFDDGSPALTEKSIGQGKMWVLTSGWQPSESQLALSTKFVPLLHRFFSGADEAINQSLNYEVGDMIPIDTIDAITTVDDPEGQRHTLEPKSEVFADTNVPGMYTITQGTQSYKVAVNLAKEESRTDPLLPGRLEQLGVDLGAKRLVAVSETEQRQMRNKELEGRQKFWRWGVLGALGLIAGETWLSRRRTEAE